MYEQVSQRQDVNKFKIFYTDFWSSWFKMHYVVLIAYRSMITFSPTYLFSVVNSFCCTLINYLVKSEMWNTYVVFFLVCSFKTSINTFAQKIEITKPRTNDHFCTNMYRNRHTLLLRDYKNEMIPEKKNNTSFKRVSSLVEHVSLCIEEMRSRRA